MSAGGGSPERPLADQPVQGMPGGSGNPGPPNNLNNPSTSTAGHSLSSSSHQSDLTSEPTTTTKAPNKIKGGVHIETSGSSSGCKKSKVDMGSGAHGPVVISGGNVQINRRESEC